MGCSDFSLKGCKFLLYYSSCCLSDTVIQRGKCMRGSDTLPPEALTGPLTAGGLYEQQPDSTPSHRSVGCFLRPRRDRQFVGEACASRAGVIIGTADGIQVLLIGFILAH